MSFIQPPTAENLDVHGAGTLLDSTRITDEQKDAAWAYLRRHGALDCAEMLGVSER